MTNEDFKLACTGIYLFTIKQLSNNRHYLHCPGRPKCSECVFGNKPKENGDCYIQDRDTLTPKQLTALKTNYPETLL